MAYDLDYEADHYCPAYEKVICADLCYDSGIIPPVAMIGGIFIPIFSVATSQQEGGAYECSDLV